MVTPVKVHLRNILLADDGSLNARAAAKLLSNLPIDSDCVVTALRVFTPLEAAEYPEVAHSIEKSRSVLADSHLNVQSEVVLGYPSEKIIEYATAHQPDLVVVGARGHGNILGSVLGSTAMNIVHEGRWPVLVVRETVDTLQRVLLLTDGSPCSQIAIRYMGVFPLPEQASVAVMHVLPRVAPLYVAEPAGMVVLTVTPEEQARMLADEESIGQNLLAETCSALSTHGVAADAALVRGDVVEEVINYINEHDIDLVVCGSRGFGTMTSWFLGSVSREIVSLARCSVMVVRCPVDAG